MGETGKIRSNGLDVSSKNKANPTDIPPSTDNTLEDKTNGSSRLISATAADQPAKINAQSSKDPSWAAHTALTLNWTGKRVLELLATYASEKSSSKNAFVKQANDSAISTN